MKINWCLTLGLLSLPSYSSQYDQAKELIKNLPPNISSVVANTPQVYEFNGRFQTGSSVSYTGQSFRQILINDLKVAMTAQLRGGYEGSAKEAKSALNSYFNYQENPDEFFPGSIDGLSLFKLSAKFMDGNTADFEEGFFYSDIQSPGKNLQSKIAGVDNPLRRGTLAGTNLSNSALDLIGKYFDLQAQNFVSGENFLFPNGDLPAQTVNLATVTPQGWDLSQLTQKFLHGAVSYSQAAGDYLSVDLGPSKGLNADNTKEARPGVGYTALEHHFDEAFGYFGAARDFLSYSDAEARTKRSKDTNGDGFVSLLKEMNLGISIGTSRIDYIAKDGLTDFSGEAMRAFLAGRHLITQRPENYLSYVKAYSHIALGAWEKTIAAIVVHYINKTTSSMKSYGTEKFLFTDFAKFFSEMKGYAFAFQFNPTGIMTKIEFDRLHALMGEQPVLPNAGSDAVEAYLGKLNEARNLLKNVYNFSQVNVENW